MRHDAIIMLPIKRLMSKLRLGKKFSIIIIISILGYVPGSYLIYSTLHENKEAAKSEFDGVNYYIPFFNLYSLILEGGNNADIQDKLEELRLSNHQNNNLYQSEQEYQEMKSSLSNRLDSSVLATVIKQFKTLFDNTVTRSQLALDPLSDSYYLMLVTTVDMPKLLASYALFNKKDETSLLPSIHDETITKKLILASEIQNKIADINLSLKKVSQDNALLNKYITTTLALLEKLNKSIIQDVQAIKTNTRIERDSLAVQTALALNNKDGLIILKDILEQRIDGFSSSFWQAGILGTVFLLIMIYCVIGFIDSLRQSIHALSESIKQISAGNLTTTITWEGRDELSDILADMDGMQIKLSQMIQEIGGVSETLNNSAHEISSGNNSLSERTQDQASCLVETSASLNNLTQTIKKNSFSASEALSLSTTANDFALKGGSEVNNVITTMSNIDESSKKIQEIIGVIDGIAFQTNLLALNASVEAARAGEQGRGFAVVAAEVRNLAQRSADAAKQIKFLINDSMSKVASGDAQVKITWATMQDIVKSIEQVNSIVEKISIESKEQSLSIEQINTVISQLEGNTQRNAAQVEEVAASAELLREQSSRLVNIVSQFEI